MFPFSFFFYSSQASSPSAQYFSSGLDDRDQFKHNQLNIALDGFGDQDVPRSPGPGSQIDSDDSNDSDSNHGDDSNSDHGDNEGEGESKGNSDNDNVPIKDGYSITYNNYSNEDQKPCIDQGPSKGEFQH